MYSFFLVSHSIIRWIFIISIVITLVYALGSRLSNKPFTHTSKLLSLITLIIVHIQFLFGLVLYFISPKVIFSSLAMKAPLTRFFLVEHVTAMLVGIILITIGYSSSKKAFQDSKKYNRILIYYIIGLLVILAAIPWPFYNLGTGWVNI